MTVRHVFPHARGLKRATLTYNSKSSCPWEIWFVASCGVPVFILSVHEDQELAAKECSKLNNRRHVTLSQDWAQQAA